MTSHMCAMTHSYVWHVSFVWQDSDDLAMPSFNSTIHLVHIRTAALDNPHNWARTIHIHMMLYMPLGFHSKVKSQRPRSSCFWRGRQRECGGKRWNIHKITSLSTSLFRDVSQQSVWHMRTCSSTPPRPPAMRMHPRRRATRCWADSPQVCQQVCMQVCQQVSMHRMMPMQTIIRTHMMLLTQETPSSGNSTSQQTLV